MQQRDAPSMTLENLRPLFDKFIQGDMWKFSEGTQKMCAMQPASFVDVDDYMSADEVTRDPARAMLREFGIGALLCSAIPMPTGELATFVFQKWLRDGAFAPEEIEPLDELRPPC